MAFSLKDSLSWFLWRSGVASLARATLASGSRFALEFHGVSSRRYQEIPSQAQPRLTSDELRFILIWLKKRFSFLTPEQFLQSNNGGLLLTFDDGLANNFVNVFPLLKELEVSAVFFITCQHVINPKDWLLDKRILAEKQCYSEEKVPSEAAADFNDGMSKEQLVECAKNPLITIGAHTVSHPFLTRCTKSRLEYELKASKQYLENVTGRSINLFAYPSGDYDKRVIESVRLAGYIAAFAEMPLNFGFPLFEIPRIGIYSPDPAYLSVKLSGLHQRPIRHALLSNGP
jgi:peptidoglycan/xylan/chitin deacetylase (PgdA/CDA1 family)